VKNFDDLPLLQVPAVKWTDADAEFHGDMKYLYDLLFAIVAAQR
jgi:hypothetical protein